MCGIIGAISHEKKNVAADVYYGLFSLQHRGEESVGIWGSDSQKWQGKKGLGDLSNVFLGYQIEDLIDKPMAIGHTRYATAGSKKSATQYVQPLIGKFSRDYFALVHNGNLTNLLELKAEMQKRRYIRFEINSFNQIEDEFDTQLIVDLLSSSSKEDFLSALIETLKLLKGSFSLIIFYQNKLYAVKDEYSLRPLCFGRKGNTFIIASETCALETVRANFIREVGPGQIIEFTLGQLGWKLHQWSEGACLKFCLFEYIYFSRPDSILFGQSVKSARSAMGLYLAQEHPAEADLIIPVPDSGNAAALGYARESNIPYEHEALLRPHGVKRTFINPAVRYKDLFHLKFNPIPDVIRNKKIVVVDDSRVRGLTSQRITEMLKEAGAREIHWRIASPPYGYHCFTGIDTPPKDNLIAAGLKNISPPKGADSLKHLSLFSTLRACDLSEDNFCTACFTGAYPPGCQPEYSEEVSLIELKKYASL